MKLFDSHAHYEDAMFDSDRHERLEALRKTDVKYVLNCCSDVSVFDTVIENCEAHDFVYGSIGIHPHWVCETPDNYLDLIRKYARHEKIAAIGEMGLDYYWKENEPWLLSQDEFMDMVHLFTADRIIFGTDCPWADQSEYVQLFESLPLSEDERRKIMGENAAKLLGL